jgi:hypothetical protein
MQYKAEIKKAKNGSSKRTQLDNKGEKKNENKPSWDQQPFAVEREN